MHLTAVYKLGAHVEGPITRYCQEREPMVALVAPLPSDADIKSKQVFYYLSAFEHKGSASDFCLRLQEEDALCSGSVGARSAWKVLAEEISICVDDTLEDLIQLETASAHEIATSADEPRGVARCGIRFGYVLGD